MASPIWTAMLEKHRAVLLAFDAERTPPSTATMPLPSPMESGDLPRGVYQATVAEIVERFGRSSRSSEWRRVLALRLERIYRIAASTGHLERFVVFGSFVSAKPDPNGVDVFMIMADEFVSGNLAGEAGLLFHHTVARAHFGCGVFWIRQVAAMDGEQAAIEDWQIQRDGSRRGVVDVTGE